LRGAERGSERVLGAAEQGEHRRRRADEGHSSAGQGVAVSPGSFLRWGLAAAPQP
jgi:hypothetical protein